MYLLVRLTRGGPWDFSRPMREQDGWARNGMLTIGSLEPWTILLDGRRSERP